MATSSTVVCALRYTDGIVMGADSQTSDHHAGVRWPVEKLRQVGSWPLVIGFSGSAGIAARARADIESYNWRNTTFQKLERVQDALESKVQPYIEATRDKLDPSHPFNIIYGTKCLWGLAACNIKDRPAILELEASGDMYVHDRFHAIGSGAQTAYAIWRTIGGQWLSELDEGRALHVMLRILQTCVGVEMSGVSGPFRIFVIAAGRVRVVSSNELDSLEQVVYEWQNRGLELLLGHPVDTSSTAGFTD